jgi:hypothetical protein
MKFVGGLLTLVTLPYYSIASVLALDVTQAFMVVPMTFVRDNHHLQNYIRKKEIRQPCHSMNSASPFSAAAARILSTKHRFHLLAVVNSDANVDGVADPHIYHEEDVPPPPPWRFQASRIHYQLRAIPTNVASKYGPSSSVVRLLSIGGYTLGGVFVVEYASSPIGQYREVAVLSGLVMGSSWTIGAWASHIFVNVPKAATYGRHYWGLAAHTVPTIDMASPSSDDSHSNPSNVTLSSSSSNTSCDIHFAANQTIQVSGWGNTTITTAQHSNDAKQRHSLVSMLSVSLSSLSGCLSSSSTGAATNKTSPLLSYPLKIQHPESISISTTVGDISFDTDDSLNHHVELKQVQDLLSNSHPLFAVDIGPVSLEAGIPIVVD